MGGPHRAACTQAFAALRLAQVGCGGGAVFVRKRMRRQANCPVACGC